MKKAKPYISFGNLLTEGIKKHALQEQIDLVPAQHQLAERLGYSFNALYTWRRGEHLPPPNTIESLAEFFTKTRVADRTWISRFLEKGEYGSPATIDAFCRRLFEPDAAAESLKIDTAPAPSLTTFSIIASLQNWNETIFMWSEMTLHHRSNWAGRLLYGFSKLTDHLTFKGVLTIATSLLLWMLTAELLVPILQWPLSDRQERYMAALYYGISTLIIPASVALVTRPDRYAAFPQHVFKQKASLWFLKCVGALVGYYVFSVGLIGFALVVYYLGWQSFFQASWWLLSGIPLFLGYVVARRIPADRYVMYKGRLRIHPADYWFMGIFLFVGSATALFLYYYAWFLANRVIGRFSLAGIAIGIALWEYKKQDREAISDLMTILVLGGVLPTGVLLFAFFMTSELSLSFEEGGTMGLVTLYVLGSTLFAATLFVRQKPTLTIGGVAGAAIVLMVVYGTLLVNLWLGRIVVISLVLLWIVWGQRRFKHRLWVHPSAWCMLVVLGGAIALLALSAIPLWIQAVVFVLMVGLLIGWVYRAR